MYERKKRSGVMLAYPFEQKRLDKWNTPYLVQPKLDGIRCRALKTDNGYLLLSSTEEVIFSVPHINEYLNAHIDQLPDELDGELYHHDLQFESIYSVTSRTANLHPGHKNIQYHVFDYISDEPQLARITNLLPLQPILTQLPLDMVPTIACESFEQIMVTYKEFISLGFEGMMVRHFLSPYVRKRSTYMMKFKPKKCDAYKIVGLQGLIDKDGNHQDCLGAFICDSGDDTTTFTVGSGLTDQQRRDYWDMYTSLINQYCLVEYQHITSGRNVPRFPVFVQVISPSEASKYEE